MVLPLVNNPLLEYCRCESCGLCSDTGPHPVWGSGADDARIIVVGEAPGDDEVIRGKPFTGRSGQLLDLTLRAAGLERDSIYITNSVVCHPHKNKTPSATDIHACNERLKQDILQHENRHIILCMGNSSIRAVLGKAQPVGRLNGQIHWSEEFQCYVAFCYHPAAVLRNPDLLRDYMWAFGRMMDYLEMPKAPIDHPVTTFYTEHSIENAIDHLVELHSAVVHKSDHTIACDIETAGFDWRHQKILEIGFCVKPGFTYILPQPLIYHDAVRPRLQRLLEEPKAKWVWHNGKFDIIWLRQQLGIDARIDADTMLMHYCVAPSTRILKTDLTWTTAGEIQVGDEVVAFDEHFSRGTSMMPATITATKSQIAQTYTIHTALGDITCSAHHLWPVKLWHQGQTVWRTTEQLYQIKGHKCLMHFVKPWEVDTSYEAGYIAEMFRPARLLPKGRDMWIGRRKFTPAEILSIEPAGEQEVIGIETTTGTFIAEGFLTHNCLDERSGGEEGGFHDLKGVAMKYCGAPSWADDIKQYLPKKSTPFSAIPAAVRHQYHAYDVDYTLRLYYELEKELKSEEEQLPSQHNGFRTPRWAHDNILVPLANVLADVEAAGVPIDIEKLNEFDKEWSTKITEYTQQIQWHALHVMSPMIDAADWRVNVRSPVQLIRILYDVINLPEYYDLRKRESLRTTKTDALREFIKLVGEHPEDYPPHSLEFLVALKDYRTIAHQHKVYIQGFRSRLDPQNHLHTTFKLHGTATGRLSSADPNLQNIPRDSLIKYLFIAEPGYTFFEADYEQLEVRVAAWYSRDPQLIRDLQQDDLHWAMAHRIFPYIIMDLEEAKGNPIELRRVAGRYQVLSAVALRMDQATLEEANDPDLLYDWIKKRLRFQTKFVTFGILYGRGAETLASPIDGLGVSVGEAARYLADFNRTYRVLYQWRMKTVNETFRNGFVETPNGRRRRYPYIEDSWRHIVKTQSANFPVQSFASDLTQGSLIRLNERFEEQDMGRILFTVHDSIAGQIRTERLEEGRQLVQHIMESTLVDPEIVFRAEVKSGRSWAECH